MGYISHIDGSYYEGDLQYGDLEVPNRPSSEHTWDGVQWNAPIYSKASKEVGDNNYKQVIRNRAKNLPAIDAVLLLKTIGE